MISDPNVKISYHTSYYDGLISGHCWYKGQYCYFDQTEEKNFKYKEKPEEIEKTKKYFTDKGVKWHDDLEYEYTGYRVYNVYPFQTPEDVIKALASKALWEELVGFQNSHNGDGISPRLPFAEGTRHTDKDPNMNDYCREDQIEHEHISEYFKKMPYKEHTDYKVDKTKSLTTFTIYDNTEELKAEGYELIELGSDE